jgi:hypothetical protein
MAPANRFFNEAKRPNDADLRKRVGATYQLIEDTITALQSEYEGIVFEWVFSRTAGWYIVCSRKKRRLFYLLPSEGDFRFRMVFGDKAVEEIKKGPFPPAVGAMLRSAKKYPEGTLLEFNKDDFNPEAAFELLKLKIAN